MFIKYSRNSNRIKTTFKLVVRTFVIGIFVDKLLVEITVMLCLVLRERRVATGLFSGNSVRRGIDEISIST